MPNQTAITNRFGERIRTLRKERGLSQEQFAQQYNLDRTYISGIERGLRNVSLQNIEVLAKTLDISLPVLFEGI